jgi:hypothetical protein
MLERITYQTEKTSSVGSLKMRDDNIIFDEIDLRQSHPQGWVIL